MASARIAGDAFAEGGVSLAYDVPAPARWRRRARLPEWPDAALSDEADIDAYVRGLYLPWCLDGDDLVIACAEKDDGVGARPHGGRRTRRERVPKQELVDALQSQFGERLAHDAALALHESDPSSSAKRVVTAAQQRLFLVIAAVVVIGGIIAPQATSAVAFIALGLLYGANIALRFVLYAVGWNGQNVCRVGEAEIAGTEDGSLPVYSVLVPLYGEAHMVCRITNALKQLDYPRLDVKLVLEESDPATIAAARALALDERFEVLVVPDGEPRTKPRACNYALRFAGGEFVVIFDAEDRPEPDQLKKAALTFRAAPDIVCLQARLAFYNANAGWLARMFALEYGGWFSIMLPGLARLGIPIPLGGTSNHFRAAELRAVGAWDAYNVTEDADLGLRLARAGKRVAPLDSTTYEEATTCVDAWIRQRSRWLKGYAQTALVHMREPLAFARSVGWLRYLASMTFVGGAVLTALVAPALWVLTAVWAVNGGGPEGAAYQAFFWTSLLLGNGALTVLAVLAALKTGERQLAAWGIFVFVYWLLASAAAYKGIWQLLNGRSSFWEKTEHGFEWCVRTRVRFGFAPRPILQTAVVFAVLTLSACAAAFANPWVKGEGNGELAATLRVVQSADGFTGDATNSGSLEFRTEYGVTDWLTLIVDQETKTADGFSDARLERFRGGARAALFRWDTGLVSIEAVTGMGTVRADDGQSYFASLHHTGEARLLVGQDFTLFGNHAWAAIEGGWRWRAGPPADEGILDVTLGLQPREDLFFMLQSFGITSAQDAYDGYQAYHSEKLQLSAVYEFAPRLWLQTGGIVSVHGADAGDAGGMLALWWRF